jgi:hypothetical protein
MPAVILLPDFGRRVLLADAGLVHEPDLDGLAPALNSDPKHLSVGTLHTPADVGGTLKSPSVRLQVGELGLRAGAEVTLEVIGMPLSALLPTIQFGSGKDDACAGLLKAAQSSARVPAAPPRVRRRAR